MLALSSLAAAHAAPPGTVLPPGMVPQLRGVVSGAAVMAPVPTATGNLLTVNQFAPRAIVDWNSFNIGSGSEVRFVQPSATAVALNRIFDADPSIIQGRLTANGQVYLLNQNGILFDRGAQINASTFLASTLNITQERFLAGIVSPAGGTPAFSGTNGNSRIDIGLNGPSDAPPPTIQTQPGGTIMMFAPQVNNNGILRAPDGQVILAAGNSVLLSLGQDYALRGFLVEVRAANGPVNLTSTVSNLTGGEIVAERGNVTLAGLAVNQSGRISATSAALNNGSIYLTARAGDRVGSVSLAAGSVTEAPIDASDPTTLTEDQAFTFRPTVRVEGGLIVHEGHIKAPGGEASLTSVGNDATSGLSRVYVGSTGGIDVGGTWVDVAGNKSLVQLKLNSDVLADAPAQKGGFLQGKTIYIDPRLGKPSFVATTPYNAAVGAVPRSAAEKAATGGSITLSATGGDVIVRDGAVLDVSGGAWRYGGASASSILVASDRTLFNVSNAPADRQYVGLLDRFERRYERWGITDIFDGLLQPLLTRTGNDFEGRSAGSLAVVAPNIVFDGEFRRNVFTGASQLAPERQPAGAALKLGDIVQAPGSLPDIILKSATIGEAPRLAATFRPDSPLATTGAIVASSLLDGDASDGTVSDRLGNVSISAKERVIVGAGADVHVREGGSILLQSNDVDVAGSLVAPGGAITLSGLNVRGIASPARVTLRSGAAASAAGAWVNDVYGPGGPGTAPVPSSRQIDGGSVSIVGQRVDLQPGSMVDVTAGAWVSETAGRRTLRTGTAGDISVTGLVLDDSTARLDGSFQAHGYSAGGRFAVSMSRLSVGDGGAASGETRIAADLLQSSGASRIVLESTGASQRLDILPGTQLVAKPEVRVIDPVASLQRATGTPLAEISSLTVQEPALVQGSSVTLTAPGPVAVGAGSSVEVNPRGSVSATSLSGIDVQGRVTAPGGSIAMTITAPSGQGSFGGGSISLAPSSVLDVAGVALTRADTRGLLLGSVLDAGTITLTARKSYVDVAPGATLDLRGTSARVDTQGLDGSLLRTTGSIVAQSNAGTLRITTTEAARLEGRILASSGGASSAGGTFVFELSQSGDPFFDRPRTIQVGGAGATTLSPDTPSAIVSLDSLRAAGVDKVVLRAQDRIDLAGGGANVALGRALALDSGQINVTDAGVYAYYAPQLTVANTFQLNTSGIDPLVRPPQRTASGNAQLVLAGNLIDLAGPLTVNGVAELSLSTPGDVRLSGRAEKDLGNGTAFADRYRGTLTTTGNINIAAAQVYPTTFSDFTIEVKDVNRGIGGAGTATLAPGGRITVARSGAPAGPVLSAGGRLTMEAETIVQGGTVVAPLGDIVLRAGDRIELADGSVTGVSAGTSTIPFGATVSGLTWSYGALANLNALPDKNISLTAPDVRIAGRATVDLSGGGDIQGTEFVPGSGGSTDTLLRSGTFAILPTSGLNHAPFDHDLQARADIGLAPTTRRYSTVFDTIHVGRGSAVPEGDYALLPGYYALLPGAYVVRAASGSVYQDMASGTSVRLPDGTTVVSGYLKVAGTEIRQSRTTGFNILTPQQALRESEYRTSDAQFFLDLALLNDRTVPRLPTDAGRLTLSATSQLDLQGTYVTAAPGTGRVADVDITAPKIAVVDRTGSSAFDSSFLQISAADLSNLNASLLLGGTRTDGAAGTAIATGASTVVLANSAAAPLRGPETALVATDTVQLRDGAVLVGSGVAVPARGFTASGDGAIVAVSTGSAMSIARGNPTPVGARGDAAIGSSVELSGTGAVLVDATRNATLSSTPTVGGGGAVSLGANTIGLGDAPAGTAGLVVSNAALSALGRGGSLTLRARQGVDVYGAVIGDLADTDVTLDTPRIRGRGESGVPGVTLAVRDLALANSFAAEIVAPSPLTGSFGIDARTVTLGPGVKTVEGFADVTLRSARTLSLAGSGALNTGGGTSIVAPRVLATTTGAQSITAGDGTSLFPVALQSGGAAAEDVAPANAAALTVAGRSVTIDTAVVLPSGRLELTSKGTTGDDGITIGANALIDLKGRDIAFRSEATGLPGGTLAASASTGAIVAAPGSRILVGGAASGGDAGTIDLRAATTVALDGVTDGRAAPTAHQGRVMVDAGSIGSFAALNAALESGGFGQLRDIRARTGDLVVGASEQVTARTITLSADAGSVDISGVLDASGAAGGGSIDVTAGADLIVRDTARLLASGASADAAQRSPGGTVRLASAGGTLTFEAPANATAGIDVSAGARGDAGSVTFVAPRSATGQIASALQGRVTGTASGGYAQGRVVLEGHRAYDVAAIDSSSGSAHYADYAAFMGDANAAQRAAAVANLLLASTQRPIVRAGIELRSGGDLSLDQAWDLTDAQWNLGGQPGTLTVRSAGTLTLNAPLGFPDIYDQNGLASGVGAQGTRSSWNLRAVGGADLTAAGLTRVGQAASGGDVVLGSSPGFDINGNLVVNAGKVRTGDGWIEIAAARDVVMRNPEQPDFIAAFGIDPTNVYGPVIATTGVLRDAAEDPRFAAGGGSITVTAGRDVVGPSTQRPFVTDWLRRSTAPTSADADLMAASGASWWVERGEFRNGIGTLGGGDMLVSAGRDIVDSHFALPTTGRAVSPSAIEVRGGGNATLTAGRDILGASFVVGLGDADVTAGGRMGASASSPLSVYLMGQSSDGSSRSAAFSATAGGAVALQNISNPTILALSGQQNFDRPGYQNFQSYFFTYAPTTSARVVALSGDLTLDGYAPGVRDIAVSQLGVIASSEFLPPRIELVAAQGALASNNVFTSDVRPVYLFPSDQREVRLLAAGDISRIGVRAINATSDVFPRWNLLNGPAVSIVESGGFFEARDVPVNPASTPQITTPAQPGGYDFVVESLAGSVYESSFRLPAASLVRAGQDIENIRLDLQNLSPEDVTRVEAGRDFRYPGTNRAGQTISVDRFRIGGPGALVIQAGRNVNFGNVTGLTAVGNTLNPTLSSEESARIVLAAGVAKPIDLDALDILMNDLKTSGVAGDTPAGDRAIANFFGTTTPGRGDVNTFFSSITTLSGSGIDVLAPRGNVNAGLTVNQGEVGYITYRGGAIRSYLSGDFNVNLAKLLTVRSGDVLIYTSAGNIDAGRGALTSRTTTPPRVLRDSSGNVTGFDVGSDASGSGIRTLTSDPDGAGPLLPPPAGTVYLFAPSGIINAGEAGIASGGDLFIRAVQVVNAANISAAGTASGVPVASVGISASVAGASAVAGAATKSAEDVARDAAQRSPTTLGSDTFRPTFINVEVLGFGS